MLPAYGSCAKKVFYIYVTCARQLRITISMRQKTEKRRSSNMVADENVNNLLDTFIHHPALRETINVILSGSKTQLRSSASPAADQTKNRSTNVTIPFGSSIYNTGRNQRRFDSPAQEFSAIFRRRGNSTVQCGINHRSRRTVSYQKAAAKSTSTVNRTRIFRTKKVILLPGVAQHEVVRGPRKSDLLGQGFIRNELEINKSWSETVYTNIYKYILYFMYVCMYVCMYIYFINHTLYI